MPKSSFDFDKFIEEEGLRLQQAAYERDMEGIARRAVIMAALKERGRIIYGKSPHKWTIKTFKSKGGPVRGDDNA